jgi:chromosome segregation ATPase
MAFTHRECAIWYNFGIMNEQQSMFAEMLGIRKQQSAKPVQVVRSVTRPVSGSDDMVDELDVQREVVEAMAIEKAELEESLAALEAERLKLEQDKQDFEIGMAALAEEKAALESEKSRLEIEKKDLEIEKRSLEERVAALESDFSALKKELESARAGNEELEEKLARMGRSLAAARRAAAESGAQGRIGGGR